LGYQFFNVFFFFSSRRRHTRSKRDWSSDVCSSDLIAGEIAAILFEKAFDDLDGPLVRVTSLDTPVPYAPTLEEHFLPNAKKVFRSEERRVGKECRCWWGADRVRTNNKR